MIQSQKIGDSDGAAWGRDPVPLVRGVLMVRQAKVGTNSDGLASRSDSFDEKQLVRDEI